MKIIHTADLHLDSKMESNLDKEKATVRREELLHTFQRMVEYASLHEVRVIMLSGDVFDKPHVRKSAKQIVLDAICEHPEIDFMYLQGNHDKADFFSDMNRDLPENIRTFSEDEWTSFEYDEDIVITGREITKDNNKTLSASLVLDHSKVNIVMLHGQESDYDGADKTEIINLNALKNKNIDYLALGHIHSYKNERLDDRGEYAYSGCLEGRGFDECGEKGFVLLDIKDHKVDSEFIPFAKRTLHEETVTVNPEMSMADIVSEAEEKVKEIPSGDLVKIVLSGNKDMDFDIDLPRIKRTFEDRFFFFKLKDKTKVRVDYEKFRNDKSLKGEFVRLIEDDETLSEEDRGLIIELGVKAIMGEEIDI